MLSLCLEYKEHRIILYLNLILFILEQKYNEVNLHVLENKFNNRSFSFEKKIQKVIGQCMGFYMDYQYHRG